MKKRILCAVMMIVCIGLLTVGVCAADTITSGDYEYFVNANGNTITITSYSGKEAEVVIPEMIDGYKVTIIGEGAFKNNKNLISVIMPDTVINVNASAFSGCKKLTSVELSENVTVIGARAFENCSSLETIDLPDKITILGEYVFSGCASLETIELPDKLTEIKAGAFRYCNSLSKITIPATVTTMDSWPGAFEGCTSLKTAGAIGTGADIEFGWTESIPQYAFRYAEIEEIIIPDGITYIGRHAFSGCTNLKKIVLPVSITSVGDNIFAGTSNLKTAGSIGSGCNIEFGWTESIPSHAFSGASSLTLVYIPKTITSIGLYAFSGCESLSNIVIPASVEKIGSNAFNGCIGLNTAGPLSDQANGIEYNIQFEWSDKIADGAFAGNEYLESIIIPEGIESIGDNAFSGCSSLKEITIPESVTSIGKEAFYNCSSLTIVVIPVKVTFVGYRAFALCKNLEFAYFYGDVPNDFYSQVFLNVSDDFSIYYSANNKSGWTTPTWNGYPAKPFTIDCSEHKYEEVVVEPTCTSTGFTKKVCSYCGDSYTVEGSEKDALGHDYSVVKEKVEATCGKQGYTVYECKNECGKTETRDYVDALGTCDFSVFVKKVEPTCRDRGYTRYECAYGCGKYENRDYVEPTYEHDFKFAWTKNPTCEEPGYSVYKCAYCWVNEERDYVSALGSHDFSVFVKTYEPTCGFRGYTKYKCSVCSQSESRDYVEPTENHQFSEKIYTSKATCLRDGEKYRICEECDHEEIIEVLPALGHDYVVKSVVEATCTEAGFSNMECSRCHEMTVDHIISAHHSFGSWTITTNPTSTVKGEMKRTCSACNVTETAEIPCLPTDNHKHTLTETVTASSCTKEGYTTYTCSCGYTYRDNYTEPFGHNFGAWVITKSAAVNENGVMERTCVRCSENESVLTPMLPEIIEVEVNTGTHEHSYSREVIKPTCEDEGYTIFTCGCGDSYKDNFKDELDHDYSEWEVTKEPTATKSGKETRVCEDCGKEDTRKLDPLGEDEASEPKESTDSANAEEQYSSEEWKNPFTDIDEYDASYEAISYVYEHNLFKGVSATRFAPDTTMNRAMFVTVVGRYAEVDTAMYFGETDFNDVVSGQWYSSYVEWASDYGIVNGYDETTFGVADEITVEQAAVMLARYADYAGYSTNAYSDLYDYADGYLVSDWAADAMSWAVENGIYEAGNYLCPQDKASRALVAEMLYRFAEWVE